MKYYSSNINNKSYNQITAITVLIMRNNVYEVVKE